MAQTCQVARPRAPQPTGPASDIRPSQDNAVARYARSASFVTMLLRTGKLPDGTPLQVMPLKSLAQ